MARLIGGSAGKEAVGQNYSSGPISAAKDGVRIQYVSQKKGTVYARILPSRSDDPALSINDPVYKSSYIPYKNAEGKFTSWYMPVQIHNFVGSQNLSFLSPYTLKGRVEGFDHARDPLVDCLMVAKSGANQDWLTLTEKPKDPKDGFSAELSKPKNQAVCNLYVRDYKDTHKWYNALFFFSLEPSLTELERQLNVPLPRSVEAMVDGQEFLFGDITDPLTGLGAAISVGKIGTISSTVFTFSNKEYTLDDAWGYPIDPNTAQGVKILEDRYDIWDDEGDLYYPSYDEIVRVISDDGFLPHDLIVKACGPHTDLPESMRKGTIYFHDKGPQSGPPQASYNGHQEEKDVSYNVRPSSPASSKSIVGPPSSANPVSGPAASLGGPSKSVSGPPAGKPAGGPPAGKPVSITPVESPPSDNAGGPPSEEKDSGEPPPLVQGLSSEKQARWVFLRSKLFSDQLVSSDEMLEFTTLTQGTE